MKTKDSISFLDEVDGLVFRLECAVKLLSSVQASMETESVGLKDQADAVLGVHDLLAGLVKELRQAVDEKEAEET